MVPLVTACEQSPLNKFRGLCFGNVVSIAVIEKSNIPVLATVLKIRRRPQVHYLPSITHVAPGLLYCSHK